MFWRYTWWCTLLSNLNYFWLCLIVRSRSLIMWAFLCAQSTFETSMVWRVCVMRIRSAWALSWWNNLFARVMNIVTWLIHSRMLNSNSYIPLPGIFCRLIRCVPPEVISSLLVYLEVASRALWGMCVYVCVVILLFCNLNKRRYIIDFPKFFLIFGLHFYELNNNYKVNFKIENQFGNTNVKILTFGEWVLARWILNPISCDVAWSLNRRLWTVVSSAVIVCLCVAMASTRGRSLMNELRSIIPICISYNNTLMHLFHFFIQRSSCRTLRDLSVVYWRRRYSP
jgi:hypothetical protein